MASLTMDIETEGTPEWPQQELRQELEGSGRMQWGGVTAEAKGACGERG